MSDSIVLEPVALGVSELADELQLSKTVLRDWIKYFSITTQKRAGAHVLNPPAVEQIREIVKLKAQGLTNDEIRERLVPIEGEEVTEAPPGALVLAEPRPDALVGVENVLSGFLTSFQPMIEDMRSQAQELGNAQGSNAALTTRLDQLTGELADVRRDKEAAQLEIGQLRAQLAMAQEALKPEQLKTERLQAQLASESAEHRRDVDALQQRQAVLQGELNDARSETAQLKHALALQQQRSDTLAHEIERLKLPFWKR